MDEIALGSLLASTLRVATPLILCAMAGVLAERSGVIDLGLEGKMLAAAFAAGAAGAVSGSMAVALAAALAVGVALSLLHGFALGGQTPALPAEVRLGPWLGGLGDLVRELPLVGPVLALALFGHNALVYGAFVAVAAVWWLLFRTRFGLRLRAAGENPAMVDAAGVALRRLRYTALLLGGAFASLAGAYLVLAQNPGFVPHMTAGRGYMALAAMIFGKWHPVGALWACLLFGFLDAVAIRLQGVALPDALGGGAVPVQAIQALPYVLTVVLLAGFIGRARAPAALGVPYSKER